MKKIYFVLFLSFTLFSKAQLSVSANQTAIALANNLLGGGVTITSPTLNCAGVANGIFSNGASTGLGFTDGVVLSTGLVTDAAGAPGYFASTALGTAGIPAMGTSTYDGCYLGFQITPKCNNLNIRYRFGSEEYNGYVGSSFNDAFGFFISGPNPAGGNYSNFNMATVPGSTVLGVAVNSINNGNSNTGPCVNCGSYSGPISGITMDGMTTALTASANVTPCQTYTLFMALVDKSDGYYDSQVFLEKSGVYCTPPVINVAGASSPICKGQSTTLSASGVSSYTWSTGAVNTSIVVSPTVTTSYTVSGGNVGSCIQDDNVVTVTVNTAPTANAGSGPALTCASLSAVLSGSGGGNYSWSGPGIVSGATTANPTINQTGTYSLIVSQSSAPFCPSTVSTVLVTGNTTPPSPTASASGSLNCSNTTTSLNATGGGSYAWSGTGIVSGGATANPVVNGTGPYVVTVTAANGCTATASTNVVQNNTPPSPTAVASNNLDCNTPNATLTGTGGGSYSWSGSGIVSGGNTANPVVNSTGPYVLTVTAANGCTATANTSLTQNITTPSPTASTSSSINCVSTTATLTGTGGGSYSWSGSGIVSGGNTANPVVNSTGLFVVTVTAANGCTATANTTVTGDITPPSPTASSPSTITCVTTNVALDATGGGSYSWSGTGIISGATTANPVVNGAGPYVVTITAANGCTASASTNVVVDNIAPSPTASSSGPLTCTNTAITLTGTSGGTYLWTGPGIVSGGSTATPLVNLTGLYDVTVTAANGCTATANTTVTQNTVTPSVTMPGTQTITCSSPTVSLDATSNPSNCNPSWTGGVCGGASTFSASACSPGSFVLTVTDPANGCVNTGTVDVVPSNGLPSVIVSNTGSITCVTFSVGVSATTTMTPVSYLWSGPGIVTGATTPSGTVNVAGTYQCIVTNTITSCSTTITTVVSSNTSPVPANVTPSASLTCLNTTVPLSATPTGTNYAYNWTGPGTITNGTTDNPTVDAGGNYVVTITDNLNGCTGNYTVNVPTDTIAPTLTLTSSSTSISCTAPTTTISASSNASNAPTWSTPAGPASNPVTATSGGDYIATSTFTNNGCSTSQTLTVISNTVAPSVDAGTFAAIPCGTPTLTLNGTTTSTDVVTYNWSGPNAGSILSGSNTANPIVMDAGVYSLTLTNSYGCSATSTINVTQGNVTASFTAAPTSGISPLLVSFTDGSTGATGFSWNFGDSGSSLSQNPSHTFTTGTYTVILTVTSGPCMDTASIVITVEDPFSLEIPNVFTPNNDGSNDIFTIKSSGVKEISLQIFNRWGQKLYEFSGPKASWDGLTPQGGQVPEGTYFYFVKATGFDGAEIDKNGTVNLFR